MSKPINELVKAKTFCVYPFIHLATLTDGAVTPCCIATPTKANLNTSSMNEAWNNDQLKQIRLDMLDDKPVSNCSQCYNDERCGVKSHRQLSNERYSKDYEAKLQDAIDTMASDGTMSVDPFTLDIRAGNTCNLKCVMCQPNESSKWVADAKKISTIAIIPELKNDLYWKANDRSKNYTWVDKPEFWSEFETMVPDIKEIIFGGGEPFLSKRINELIQFMVDSGHSKHMMLRFHTNGSQIPKTFWPLVDSFERIELLFSIDGYKEQNYYIRYPADWSEIEKNLLLADQTKAETRFLSSLHAMNVLNIVDLYKWRLDQPYQNINKKPFILGRVYHPGYMNPQRLPANVKMEVKSRIETFLVEYKDQYPTGYFNDLESNLNWILEDAPGGSDALVEYISHLDTVRGTNFHSTFPDLSALLK